jgi:hypothetical protein
LIALTAAADAEVRNPAHGFPEEEPELREVEVRSDRLAASAPQGHVRGDRVSWLSVIITFADEEPVTIVVHDQGLATYRSFRHDESFGVVPRLDQATGDVEVQLVTISGERPRYRAEQILATLHSRAGFEVVGTSANAALPISIRVDEAEAALAAASGEGCVVGGATPDRQVAMFRDLYADGTCCVTCSGGEWCGCTVSTDCGGCSGCK